MKELIEILTEINDKKLMTAFLGELLTPAEKKRLVNRIELVKMLSQGVPQRTIAEKLGISLCNITRGSRELKKKNSAFKKALNLE